MQSLRNFGIVANNPDEKLKLLWEAGPLALDAALDVEQYMASQCTNGVGSQDEATFLAAHPPGCCHRGCLNLAGRSEHQP